LLAVSLVLALAPAGLAAPGAPNDEGDPSGLWVQPDGPMSWESAEPAFAAAAPERATVTATSPLIMCSGTGVDASITSGALATVAECDVTVPQNGWLYVAANGTVWAEGSPVDGSFRIGVDAVTWTYDRAVSVHTDALKVRQKVASINALRSIGPGTHTVSFQARRSDGTGTLRLTLPTISVIFIPSTGSFRACSAVQEGAWTTDLTTSQPVVSCDISAPTSGYLFYAVNGWLSAPTGTYEAFYRVQHDSSLPPGSEDNTYRRQDVYEDVFGGGDDTFTATGIRWVDAGTRTTTLRVGKWGGSGTGTVTLNDATVSAFFFEPIQAQAQVCRDLPGESWFTPFQYFDDARLCDLSLPSPSKVFLSADGYSGMYVPSAPYPFPVGPYRMGARLGVDSSSGIASTQREVNVVSDPRDMSDMSFANVAVKPVRGGAHRVYWSGALLSNPASGTAAVYRVGLTAIAIPDPTQPSELVYLPLIQR
jgi:hypothetical protein